MSPADTAEAPIYDSLVAERGDVPAETRKAAEKANQEVSEAMNFPGGHSAPRTDEAGGRP